MDLARSGSNCRNAKTERTRQRTSRGIHKELIQRLSSGGRIDFVNSVDATHGVNGEPVDLRCKKQVGMTALADPGLWPFTYGHDLFGDGSLVLLPTPGHIPGSLSMLVRRPARRPLIMVGDLTYDHGLLTEGKLPGVGNKRQMRTATDMVNHLRRTLPGLVILPAHDPSAAARLDSALQDATDDRRSAGVREGGTS